MSISVSAVIALAASFILVGANHSFLQQLLQSYPLSLTNVFFLASVLLSIISLFYLILICLSAKYIFRPVLALIFLITAISAYAMDTYGYVMAAQTFQNVFESNVNEITDLLSLKLFLYLLVLAVLPIYLLYKAKINYSKLKTKLKYFIWTFCVLVLNIGNFSSSYASLLRNHKELRYYVNPIRPLYSLAKYYAQRFNTASSVEFKILDHNPVLSLHDGKPRLVILVIGESDRALNHSLNGYHKSTNPFLASRDDVYSFSQFYSCGTETSIAVPCMFSSYTRHDFSYHKGRYTENVLDLLHKSNVRVLWRDNDNGCKNVCDRVANEDFSNARLKPYCNGIECHDEILLHNLRDYIDVAKGDQLIVLHKKGNHGPAYYKRYPKEFEKFSPVCKTNELQNCSKQEIINTYDNIVVYTDYFLHKVISLLESYKNYQTAMIYVSDHGESLGENGIYLHAMPYALAPKEQMHVPFIIWTSKDFTAVDKNKLAKIQHQSFSHDNLFHSLLGLYKVKTLVYDSQFDMFY